MQARAQPFHVLQGIYLTLVSYLHTVPAAAQTRAKPPPGPRMGFGARSRCAELLWEPDLEGFPGRLEAESSENLVRVSAYFRVSPSCLKSEWGKIIWKKSKYAWHFLSFPSNESCSFPHLKTTFCSIFLQRHFPSWLSWVLSIDCLSPPLPPPSLPLSIWLNLLFPHVAQVISEQSFLTFSYYHSPVISKLNQNPKFLPWF